jgi:hypothetical protein
VNKWVTGYEGSRYMQEEEEEEEDDELLLLFKKLSLLCKNTALKWNVVFLNVFEHVSHLLVLCAEASYF